MTVPPIVARRVLPAPQREALDLMLRALFILDRAGELGPGAALSGAIDALIDAPNAADMTPQERAEFAGRLDAYQAAVTIAQGKALPLTFHG